jgi:hypothetical protein
MRGLNPKTLFQTIIKHKYHRIKNSFSSRDNIISTSVIPPEKKNCRCLKYNYNLNNFTGLSLSVIPKYQR